MAHCSAPLRRQRQIATRVKLLGLVLPPMGPSLWGPGSSA